MMITATPTLSKCPIIRTAVFFLAIFVPCLLCSEFEMLHFPGIVQYMLEQSKPPSTEVNTVKAMRNLLHHASDVTIIGCFKGEDDPMLEIFQVAGVMLILYR